MFWKKNQNTVGVYQRPAPPKRVETRLPERDSKGQIIDYQERMDELPLVTVPPTSPEFAKQLKAIFQQAVKTCGLLPQSAAEQFRKIVYALHLKVRGRWPTFEAQTPAIRKRLERQRKEDYSWLSFPILSHAPYLIIEASPEDEVPSFDLQHARTIIGYELQRMMDAHCKTYPDQKPFAEQSEPGLRYETEKNRTAVLVLEYPDDRVCYIAPMYTTPPTSESVLAGRGFGSLNRGLFLGEAPKGKGKVVSGWRQTGYRTNTAERDQMPGVDKDFSNYTDEFTNEDDDTSPSENPGGPELKVEEVKDHPYVFRQKGEEFAEALGEKEKNDAHAGANEEPDDVLKCRICQEVLEGDEGDDTLLFKHLEERHPDEYRRICRKLEEQFDKARETEKKRERQQLEKQKYCREDHDGMFTRQLAAHDPTYFYKDAPQCGTCKAPLCRGTHVRQVGEVFAERNAYRKTLSAQERLDASKRKDPPIKCKYCGETIDAVDYT